MSKKNTKNPNFTKGKKDENFDLTQSMIRDVNATPSLIQNKNTVSDYAKNLDELKYIDKAADASIKIDKAANDSLTQDHNYNSAVKGVEADLKSEAPISGNPLHDVKFKNKEVLKDFDEDGLTVEKLDAKVKKFGDDNFESIKEGSVAGKKPNRNKFDSYSKSFFVKERMENRKERFTRTAKFASLFSKDKISSRFSQKIQSKTLDSLQAKITEIKNSGLNNEQQISEINQQILKVRENYEDMINFNTSDFSTVFKTIQTEKLTALLTDVIKEETSNYEQILQNVNSNISLITEFETLLRSKGYNNTDVVNAHTDLLGKLFDGRSLTNDEYVLLGYLDLWRYKNQMNKRISRSLDFIKEIQNQIVKYGSLIVDDLTKKYSNSTSRLDSNKSAKLIAKDEKEEFGLFSINTTNKTILAKAVTEGIQSISDWSQYAEQVVERISSVQPFVILDIYGLSTIQKVRSTSFKKMKAGTSIEPVDFQHIKDYAYIDDPSTDKNALVITKRIVASRELSLLNKMTVLIPTSEWNRLNNDAVDEVSREVKATAVDFDWDIKIPAYIPVKEADLSGKYVLVTIESYNKPDNWASLSLFNDVKINKKDLIIWNSHDRNNGIQIGDSGDMVKYYTQKTDSEDQAIISLPFPSNKIVTILKRESNFGLTQSTVKSLLKVTNIQAAETVDIMKEHISEFNSRHLLPGKVALSEDNLTEKTRYYNVWNFILNSMFAQETINAITLAKEIETIRTLLASMITKAGLSSKFNTFTNNPSLRDLSGESSSSPLYNVIGQVFFNSQSNSAPVDNITANGNVKSVVLSYLKGLLKMSATRPVASSIVNGLSLVKRNSEIDADKMNAIKSSLDSIGTRLVFTKEEIKRLTEILSQIRAPMESTISISPINSYYVYEVKNGKSVIVKKNIKEVLSDNTLRLAYANPDHAMLSSGIDLGSALFGLETLESSEDIYTNVIYTNPFNIKPLNTLIRVLYDVYGKGILVDTGSYNFATFFSPEDLYLEIRNLIDGSNSYDSSPYSYTAVLLSLLFLQFVYNSSRIIIPRLVIDNFGSAHPFSQRSNADSSLIVDEFSKYFKIVNNNYFGIKDFSKTSIDENFNFALAPKLSKDHLNGMETGQDYINGNLIFWMDLTDYITSLEDFSVVEYEDLEGRVLSYTFLTNSALKNRLSIVNKIREIASQSYISSIKLAPTGTNVTEVLPNARVYHTGETKVITMVPNPAETATLSIAGTGQTGTGTNRTFVQHNQFSRIIEQSVIYFTREFIGIGNSHYNNVTGIFTNSEQGNYVYSMKIESLTDFTNSWNLVENDNILKYVDYYYSSGTDFTANYTLYFKNNFTITLSSEFFKKTVPATVVDQEITYPLFMEIFLPTISNSAELLNQSIDRGRTVKPLIVFN